MDYKHWEEEKMDWTHWDTQKIVLGGKRRNMDSVQRNAQSMNVFSLFGGLAGILS